MLRELLRGTAPILQTISDAAEEFYYPEVVAARKKEEAAMARLQEQLEARAAESELDRAFREAMSREEFERESVFKRELAEEQRAFQEQMAEEEDLRRLALSLMTHERATPAARTAAVSVFPTLSKLFGAEAITPEPVEGIVGEVPRKKVGVPQLIAPEPPDWLKPLEESKGILGLTPQEYNVVRRQMAVNHLKGAIDDPVTGVEEVNGQLYIKTKKSGIQAEPFADAKKLVTVGGGLFQVNVNTGEVLKVVQAPATSDKMDTLTFEQRKTLFQAEIRNLVDSKYDWKKRPFASQGFFGPTTMKYGPAGQEKDVPIGDLIKDRGLAYGLDIEVEYSTKGANHWKIRVVDDLHKATPVSKPGRLPAGAYGQSAGELPPEVKMLTPGTLFRWRDGKQYVRTETGAELYDPEKHKRVH